MKKGSLYCGEMIHLDDNSVAAHVRFSCLLLEDAHDSAVGIKTLLTKVNSITNQLISSRILWCTLDWYLHNCKEFKAEYENR